MFTYLISIRGRGRFNKKNIGHISSLAILCLAGAGGDGGAAVTETTPLAVAEGVDPVKVNQFNT